MGVVGDLGHRVAQPRAVLLVPVGDALGGMRKRLHVSGIRPGKVSGMAACDAGSGGCGLGLSAFCVEFLAEGAEFVGEFSEECFAVLYVDGDVGTGAAWHSFVEVLLIEFIGVVAGGIHDIGQVEHGEVGVREFGFEAAESEEFFREDFFVAIEGGLIFVFVLIFRLILVSVLVLFR
jgi:hypothetical protein